MNRRSWIITLSFVLFVGATLLTAGCAKPPEKAPVAKPSAPEKGQTHDGWWCDEHGVPEAICGQCDQKVAAECKKKGDWCEKHDRPDSQCFICHPELKEKFAAQYRAKYGKEPPPMEEETPKK